MNISHINRSKNLGKKSHVLMMIARASPFLFLVAAAANAANACPCRTLLNRPKYNAKELSARWMTHTMDWGVLSTISSRLDDKPPFGNVYSFVDGPCDASTGTPYFYGSHMDQSFADLKENNRVSFTLSEAAFPFTCGGSNFGDCALNGPSGDPENPTCARLTLTGTLVEVENGSEEYKKVQSWFFERHRSMAQWPEDHGWAIAKLEIVDIWFIDFFGGAFIMDHHDYHAAKLNFTDATPAKPKGSITGGMGDMGGPSGHHGMSGHDGKGAGNIVYMFAFVLILVGSVVLGNVLHERFCARHNYGQIPPFQDKADI